MVTVDQIYAVSIIIGVGAGVYIMLWVQNYYRSKKGK